MADDVQNKQRPDQGQPTQQPMTQPVSVGMAKEQEMPASSDIQLEDVQEYEVPKEVSAHVQIQKQIPDIPPDLKQMGVTHAPSDQTISDTTSLAKKTPLTDDQINDGLQKPPTDSFRWFAEWCLKQLKLMHVHLTKVKGRYIRVTDEK
ncbi:MAG: hypothetical protein UU81_C0057G0011 [Microgenomates group bacterium GW2011_GWC1_41_8]|uniref:Uncharacterized protein n=3 Tax=Candidatus Roizmaniibacteriota TaxID=1752723 RepID=A0A0G0XF95_9BACT|nr:MAG: hypothetical protein UU14_C0005G0009 [Candidatus Roizmanbacteria bacterium GW2011_GWB1_40_7]KKR92345.1 MAG: hypothetical protein UU41_C0027G0006 [Candidatus Roizmanbacteria bacterium GW2011_GWA1_41_13]KKS22291.1 MAG: hypothetical protein UU81_C0057G0011 [Microgenomates group bacterium GW2011_GWC1_41_8]KKS23092.1 MAG: hypothetical protein UU78_C0004G0007 [Candidatus Roizmanbacteria bacterium GW2011_GWC2_41_7]